MTAASILFGICCMISATTFFYGVYKPKTIPPLMQRITYLACGILALLMGINYLGFVS